MYRHRLALATLLFVVMILVMYGGFAFLEAGSVRKKNQVNTLNKIICEWSFLNAHLFLNFKLALLW